MSRWPAPLRARLLGAALLLSAAVGGAFDPSLFFAAWLAAWWFCLGLALGPAANRRIHVLTGGRWGEVLVAPSDALQRALPALLLLAVPLLAGAQLLYPWAAADASPWLATMPQPAFQKAWFAEPFVGTRLVAYAIATVWLTRSTIDPRRPSRAAFGLIVQMFVISLAAVDLVTSLLPGWSSSVFGWLALVGQLVTGAAAASGLAALTAHHLPAAPRDDPPVWRDLGNLVLMYVLLQAYLQFIQFLIIWAENLPREISWYLPRVQTGWAAVGIALIALQFAAPLVALLWRRNKDEPPRLARIAAGIVVTQGVGAAWLVVPSVRATGFAAWAMLPAVFIGMTLLLYGGLWPARSKPLPNRTVMDLADGRA